MSEVPDSSGSVPTLKLLSAYKQEQDEDHPFQTLGPYLPDSKLPQTRLADSEAKDPKYYKLILVKNGKAIGDTI